MTDKSSGNFFLLISCTLASFITPFMSSSINVALPIIGKEFSMDAILLSWVATTFLLSSAVFLVPMGRIADIYGRKKVFLTGMIIYTITSLLLTFSFNAYYLLIVRIVQGIGASMVFSTSVALMISIYPPNERGKIMGILVTAVYVGISVGPVAGGFLTQHLGWRSLFALNTLLGLVATIFIFTKLSFKEAVQKNEEFDWQGSLLYGIALSLLMYGFSKIPSILGFILTTVGIIGVITFFIFEKNHKSPVLDVKLFLNNKVFTFSNLAALINYSATFATGFLLSLYLQYIRGFKPDAAGMILISQPIVMALFSSITGKLSDRIEPRFLATTGMALDTLGLFFFFFLTPETPIYLIVINLTIIGFGFAMFSSPNMNAIMGSVEKKYYGVSSAMVGTMRLLGQMMSMGFAMIIFSVITGKVQIKPDTHGLLMPAVTTAFLLFSILCFTGVFLSATRGNVRGESV